jgi:protein SCO1
MAAALGTAAAIPGAAGADSPRLDADAAFAASERAVGHTIGDYVLVDSSGRPLPLAELRGKPLVISLVYTACSSICPPTTQHVATAVEQARRTIGPQAFTVLTVGFDARRDTPGRMAEFAATQHAGGGNWRFASGDPDTIAALLRDVGFSYAAVAGGFDHVAQTTIVDAGGKVYRQIYGDDFPVRMLIEPLKSALLGTAPPLTVRGLADRLRYICTAYDPGAGRYRIDYALVFGSVIGALSLAVFGALLLREWRRAGRA